jgi:two-component system sensor histidine kinase PilS (NtrC family)
VLSSPLGPADQHALLRVYAIYRLILAALLLALFHGLNILGGDKPALFSITLNLYALLAFATLVRVHLPGFQPAARHTFLICCMDVACISLLMHASGGVVSGLGLLLVVPISTASITLRGQISTLLAAVATLAILASTLYDLMPDFKTRISDLLPAGLMGFLLFVTSRLFEYITSRMRLAAEHAELQTQRRLQTQRLNDLIVQRMLTGIVVLSPDDTIRMMNQSAATLLDVSSQHSSWEDGTVPADRIPVLQACLEQWRRAPHIRAKPVKLRDAGPELQLSFAGLDKSRRTDVIVFVEDTRKLAQQAQQLKLASLGHLTASIAHEIRNPIGAISHAAQLLGESTAITEYDRRLAQIIQDHTRRVNLIVENILQLSRRNNSIPSRVPMQAFLDSFVHNYRMAHPGNLQIELQCPEEPVFINIDTSQIEQVLTNLCDNGLRYSLQATGKSHLLLRGFNDAVLGTPCLAVIDDGPGISAENEGNIFEPFFTTEVHGTGLGLYLARELCESNQARLDYLRTPEGKSCFEISFSHPDRSVSML